MEKIQELHIREGHSIRKQIAFAMIFWTMVNVLFGFMGYTLLQETNNNLARIKGQEAFNKDQAFRFWATRHGGVYVPVSQNTPANPYLSHVQERDIVTPNGKKLTLMNPAYMVRQLNEYYSDLFGVRGHITSLNPLRPENGPDEWEKKALNKFRQGATEYSEIQDEDGVPCLRLMRPMMTKKACLKCHGHQGYKEGDIRGGVSVKVPLTSIISQTASQNALIYQGIPAVWTVGILLLAFAARRIDRSQQEKAMAQKKMTHESILNDSQARIVQLFFQDNFDIIDVALAVMEGAQRITGSANSALTYVDPRSQQYVELTNPPSDTAGCPTLRNATEGPSVPHSTMQGLWNLGKTEAQSFFTNDPEHLPFFSNIPAGHIPIQNILSTPVAHNNNILGTLALANTPRGFTNTSLTDVSLLADLFAIGLQRLQLQETLLHSKELAESANKAKSEFLANMSHEVRTPLNGVHGMLQLLHSTALSIEQKEYVSNAIHATKRLTHLLSDILDLSRVEAGKITLNESPLEIRKILDSVEDLFQLSILQARLTLTLQVDENIPKYVAGDELRLLQILINLVGNALKFTKKGGITITASVLPHQKPDSVKVLFSVTDTGIGIADEKVATLFSPFTQVSEGFRRDNQGAGLGLAITKRLVELMNGSIAVESKPASGTAVYFTVRFSTVADEGTIEAEKATRFTPGLGADLAGLRILLAEDEHVNRLATSRMLRKCDTEVALAIDGQQVLEILKNTEQSFDLILMDIQMPVMDGLDATRAIRGGLAGRQHKDTPIIALTAYAMDGDKERFLAHGMDGYLAKPVDLYSLQQMIANLHKTQI